MVYVIPVFTSPSNHRYDTVDYRSVDPMLGGDEALEAMVEALHRRSIRVILDVSLNHTHPRSPRSPTWSPGARHRTMSAGSPCPTGRSDSSTGPRQ